MKLLLLSSEFPPGPGGIGTHAHQLATHLCSRWDVTVATPQDYAPEDEVQRFNAALPFSITRFHHHSVSTIEGLSRARILSRIIRERKPDVVLASGRKSVWLAAGLRLRFNIPTVAVGHGTEFGASPPWSRMLTKWAFEHASAVVSVSRYTRDQMYRTGVRPERDDVIPNGADVSRFRPLSDEQIRNEKARLGLGEERILLTVGRVSERKGQDVVIRALPEVLRQVGRVQYVVVGLREKEAEFAKLARRLGVAQHVQFLGRVTANRVVQLLNCSDLFLMTSRITETGEFEGYGIAVIEAALCGIPAVVSSAGGLPETVEDGVTGRIVADDDPEATAAAIIQLLTDDSSRKTMGGEARRLALTERTWERRAEQYHEILLDVTQVRVDARSRQVRYSP